MTTEKVITGTLRRVQRAGGKGFVSELPPVIARPRRPARVAIMLALAHKIAAAIARGQLRGQADAAQRFRVTRARVTQLLGVLTLAPDLQERVLLLEAVDEVEPLTEHALRDVARALSWAEQRARSPSVLAAGPATQPFGAPR